MKAMRIAAILGATTMAAALLIAPIGPASAATCPTVDGTGTVSPPPAAGVDWSGCHLNGGVAANLQGADLSSAQLVGADLGGANLSGANLSGANLTGANLGGTNLTDAVMTNVTVGSTILFAADLTRADLSGVNWGNTDFRFTVWTGATIANASLSFTNFSYIYTMQGGVQGLPSTLPSGWYVKYGFILGPTAFIHNSDLSGLDLSGLDMRGVVFNYSDMSNTNLSGTRLAGATLSGVKSGGVVGVPESLPSNTSIAGGYILAQEAFIEGADFSGLQMPGIYARGAQAADTKWIAADLTGSDLGGADLRRANFTSAALTGASLGYSDLTDANFTDANLTGASYQSAQLGGAIWTRATCSDGYKAEKHVGFTCLGALDIASPTVRVTSPSTMFQARRVFKVAWTASDSGSGVNVTAIRYNRTPAAGGTTSSWATPSAWASLKGSNVTFNGATGYRYCFSARTQDKVGNWSPWTSARCTVTPTDDRSLAVISGSWLRGTGSGYLNSTYTQATRAGSTLTTSSAVTVRNVGVVARRCPSCGVIAVLVDGVKVGTISLYSSATTTSSVVMLPKFGTQWHGKVRLKIVSSGKTVRIDGLILSSV